jgi:hypothetical protein
MSDMLDATNPQRCQYQIVVIWPNGERSEYIGIDLDAETIATNIEHLASEIRAELREEPR